MKIFISTVLFLFVASCSNNAFKGDQKSAVEDDVRDGNPDVFLPGGIDPFVQVGQTLPDGSIQYPDGSIKLPDDTIKHPENVVNLPDGGVKYPDGTIKYPDGTIKLPDGTTRLPDGTIQYPDGTVKFPDINVRVPMGSTRLPDGTVKLPDGSVVDHNGNPVTDNPVIDNPIVITPDTGTPCTEGDFVNFKFPTTIQGCLNQGKLWDFTNSKCSNISSYTSGCSWDAAVNLVNSTQYQNGSSQQYINEFISNRNQGHKLTGCAKSDAKGIAVFQYIKSDFDNVSCTYNNQGIFALCSVQNINTVPAGIRSDANAIVKWCLEQY